MVFVMAYNPKYSKKHEEYRSRKYKRVGLDFEKEYYDTVLKPAADASGMPVNTFIKEAIKAFVAKDSE